MFLNTHIRIAILTLVVILMGLSLASSATNLTEDAVQSGIVIFKIKPNETLGNQEFIDFLIELTDVKVERTFPHCNASKADLERIFTLHFSNPVSPEILSNDLSKLSIIEYAEPKSIHRWFLDHNDPLREDQWGLDAVSANAAHDITTGSRDIVIAIIDLGIDMQHSDLVDNLWINPNEEDNGQDSDENGFVDDIHGWDFVGNDNNPQDQAQQFAGHGTHVAGIASAVTNNEIGVASVAYSSSLMIVRAGDDRGVLAGFEGIEYAASNGAKIINCSWGNFESRQMEQDVIDYAYEQGALVFCAAGNSGNSQRSYPATYNHALAVAASDQNDRKWAQSNYGDWVTLCAPGVDIVSTMIRGGYHTASGTSMASPFAASVAGLIWSAVPERTNDEVRQLLIDGCDNMDDNHPQFRGQMGAGRVNALSSLELIHAVSINITEFGIIDDDNQNGKADPGETISMAVTFHILEGNDPIDELHFRLETESEVIEMVENETTFQNIAPGDDYSNLDEPFVFRISGNSGARNVEFVLRYYNDDIEGFRNYDVLVGTPEIILVEDVPDFNVPNSYGHILNRANYRWARWHTFQKGAPTVEDLSPYEVIVWNSGNTSNPLSNDDRNTLTTLHQQGKHLLLIGNRIGNDPDNEDFIENVFKAEHYRDSIDTDAVRGRIYGNNNYVYDFEFGFEEVGSGLSPSWIEPLENAEIFMSYYKNNERVGTASVFNRNVEFNSRTYYVPFLLNATTDDPNLFKTHLFRFMLEILKLGEINVPEDNSLPIDFEYQPTTYPNPFNNTTIVKFFSAIAGGMSIEVIDVNGRSLGVLYSGNSSAGWNSIPTDFGKINAPAGSYLMKLKLADGREFTKRVVLTK